MGGQRGSHTNRERLQELGEEISIRLYQIRRCLHVQKNFETIIGLHTAELETIKAKMVEVNDELGKAPAKLVSLRRQLDKFRAEQDKITGHVTGRTKLVNKYKRAKAQLEAIEAKLSDSGLDVGDIQVEPLTSADAGDE